MLLLAGFCLSLFAANRLVKLVGLEILQQLLLFRDPAVHIRMNLTLNGIDVFIFGFVMSLIDVL